MQSAASLWPRQPVLLQLPKDRLQLKRRELQQPRAFPKVANPGCARFPVDWNPFFCCIQTANSVEDLTTAWDLLLTGIEEELANRRDLIGIR